MRSRRPLRFTWQILLLQLLVVVVLLAAGIAFALALLSSELSTESGTRALAIARSVADGPRVARRVAARERGGQLQRYAERVRRSTGVLFVVITDDRGIRLAHPDPGKIGRRVSTDPSRALAGHDVVNVRQVGTLGASVRSKVPVRAGDRVVGEVSVGFDTDLTGRRVRDNFGVVAAFAAGALALGVAASVLLTRRLRRQTLGLEPHELAALVSDREAVLHGIGDGVLAVDAAGRVAVCNAEACTLLGADIALGTPAGDAPLPPRLAAALDSAGTAGRAETDNLVTVAGSRVLVAKLRAVYRGQRYLGVVLTLRDRTELDTLSRELDAVRGLTDGLRAQQHEFTNRLHTLSGLLQLGHTDEAVSYLDTLTEGALGGPSGLSGAVADPHLRALLYAKTVAAQEKGVQLTVGESTWAAGTVSDPVRVTTVVGNLVDNAVRAAASGTRRPATVEVELLSEGSALHVTVLDSGDGVPESLGQDVFVEGTSTKDGGGHGIGLALARQAAQARGGTLRLAERGGPEGGDRHHGAVFVATLPQALSAEVNA